MKTILSCLLLAAPLSLLAQLNPVKVTDHITVSMPADFRVMTPQEINAKFVSARIPLAMYTDYGVTVDFGVNKGNNQWGQGDLNIMSQFYKANITALYDDVVFTKEGTETIGDKTFAVFEFTALIKPEENSISRDTALRTYNYIQYTIVNNQTVVFTLSCAQRYMEKWKPIAPQIMQSVTIKKNFK